jgi:hypothetical protein
MADNISIQEQVAQLKKRNNRWDIGLATIMVSLLLGGFIGWHWLNKADFSTMYSLIKQGSFDLDKQTTTLLLTCLVHSVIALALTFFALSVLSACNDLLFKYALKEYVLEDCGEVIKLHGSFRLMWWEKAQADLLAVRPGYKIFEGNAFQEYGCTLAAVKATQEELAAKKTLMNFRVLISEIGDPA